MSATEGPRLVGQAQALLESLNRLEGGPSAADFLATDRACVDRLAPEAHEADEHVLLREAEGELELLLFLDGDLIGRLAEDDPFESLHGGNLGDFQVLLEGVSHFLYIADRAATGRATRLVELEVQAEIDKFFAACFAIDPGRPASVTGPLWQLQFERFRLADGLSPTASAMYIEANRIAARFCGRLTREHAGRGSAGLLTELRDFHGLGWQRKVRAAAGS
ncbi:MAG: hypothetical protein AAGE01_14675 [Pseudomonadota bacterium]